MAGLANLSPFFQNPLFTRTINEVPVNPSYIGEKYLPRENTYDTKFYESTIVRQADMANIVSLDAEIALTDRDPMRSVSGEVADISQGYIVSKEEMAAMMDKGTFGEAKRKLVTQQLLNKAARIKENVDARIEWMRWQALGNGQLFYAKNGVHLSVDFGVTMKKVAATRWDDVDPDILGDYEAWVQEYVDKNGVAPEEFVTSLKALRTIMNNPNVRKAITGLSDKIVTLDELNSFLVGRQMPKIVAFDTTVTYRDVNNDGQRVTQRLLAENKGVFVRSGGEIGVQLLGPTVENEMNPGIFARTIHEEFPMRDIIQIVASSFPKVTNPDLIGIATILV
jgi:hypothetical protein